MKQCLPLARKAPGAIGGVWHLFIRATISTAATTLIADEAMPDPDPRPHPGRQASYFFRYSKNACELRSRPRKSLTICCGVFCAPSASTVDR
jgi:hypothetical protein